MPRKKPRAPTPSKRAPKAPKKPDDAVSRVAQYKRCDLDDRSLSLCQSIMAAYHDLDVGSRFWENPVTKARRFINDFVEIGGGAWCGVLYEFTPGGRPAKVKIDRTARRLELAKIEQLADDEEVLESALFFLVHQNHVVLTSGGSMRALQLTDYLNWLLREQTTLLKDQVPFNLLDEPSNKVRQNGGLVHVKSLSFDAPLTSDVLMSTASGESTSRARLARVLSDLLRRGTDELLPALADIRPDELDRLHVKLEIKYVGRRKKGQDWHLLDWLARTMDDDLGDRSSFQADGVILDGNDLKLKQVLQVRADPHRGLDLSSVGVASLAWLQSLLMSGRIRPCSSS